jgi:ABC-type transport system involved in multi-copper enzyme maturation permease subunit
MKQSLKSELRKLLSVRTTYGITAVMLLLVAFVSFWVFGYNYKGHVDTNYLQTNLLQSASFVAIFVMVVSILLMAHEYRYNTIYYSLTASKSRTRFLAAKIITVLIYGLVMALASVILSWFLMVLGHNMAQHPLPPQQLNLGNILWRNIFYIEGLALAGLMVATLIRNLVFDIVFMFIVPNTIESLLTLVLKQKAAYLPFSALSQVVATIDSQTADTGPFQVGHLSPVKGAVVFSVYLLVGWLITWQVFLRRDAN